MNKAIENQINILRKIKTLSRRHPEMGDNGELSKAIKDIQETADTAIREFFSTRGRWNENR